MMLLLKICKIKLAKISALSIIILKGISYVCVDFEVFKLLTSFSISSQVTFRKENTLLFIFSFMLRMLVLELYFLIAFKIGSNKSFVSTRYCLSFSICKVFPLFTKNLLKVSASFSV